MYWNHRIVEENDNGEKSFLFAEVLYNSKTNKPEGYTTPFTHSETRKGLKKLLKRLKGALDKPTLKASDFTAGGK